MNKKQKITRIFSLLALISLIVGFSLAPTQKANAQMSLLNVKLTIKHCFEGDTTGAVGAFKMHILDNRKNPQKGLDDIVAEIDKAFLAYNPELCSFQDAKKEADSLSRLIDAHEAKRTSLEAENQKKQKH